MIATMLLPPSPALSACDSLADIDDLDAYILAQGPLSRFATPPLPSTKAVTIEYAEVFDSDGEYEEDEEDELDCR